jgi:antitoxin (DNA-binding transcriptional repressor) of toxin-antitoxin stability system
MTGTVLSATSAVRHFSDYLNRVAYRGEVFILSRGGQPLAELRPLPAGRRLGDLPGMVQGLPPLAADDDEAFEADVSAIRKAAGGEKKGLRNPWA